MTTKTKTPKKTSAPPAKRITSRIEERTPPKTNYTPELMKRVGALNNTQLKKTSDEIAPSLADVRAFLAQIEKGLKGDPECLRYGLSGANVATAESAFAALLAACSQMRMISSANRDTVRNEERAVARAEEERLAEIDRKRAVARAEAVEAARIRRILAENGE